jgi:YVTN family beta-propeller protein
MLSALILAFTLVVANRGGSVVTLINPKTMQYLAQVACNPEPHEVAISKDGRYAYVTNYIGSNGATLTVVDLDTRKPVKTIQLGTLVGPHGLVEHGGRLWFTAEKSQAVGRYDPVADRVDWVGRTDQLTSHMLAVNRAGTVVYTANVQSHTASVIPVEGEQSVSRKNIATVAFPEGIALRPDEKELWVGSSQANGISIIDVATETVVATIAQGKPAYRIVFSPDGRFAFVPRQRGIVVYDVATRVELRTIPTVGITLSVLTDGRFAYIAMTQPDRVVMVDLETDAVVGSVDAPPVPDGMALAPVRTMKKRRAVR